MANFREWNRWRKELRHAEREMWRTQTAWRRASYAYQDAGVVYRGTPGARGPGGGIALAMEAVDEAWAEYVPWRDLVERMKTTGP